MQIQGGLPVQPPLITFARTNVRFGQTRPEAEPTPQVQPLSVQPDSLTVTAPAPAKKPAAENYRNPEPDSTLMEATGPVAEHLLLGKKIPHDSMKTLLPYAPVIGKVPLLSHLSKLPGLGGRFKIENVDLPEADLKRLQSAVSDKTAAFLAPNHPEFMTDWLIDKYLSMRAAPNMAAFAAAGVIEKGKTFWLKNNVIANNGGEKAEEYAVNWALGGNAVLLHPEGTVHWNGDVVRHLMPGVSDMALEAARRSIEGDKRPVYIVPMIWKLTFNQDVSKGLNKEMTDLEKRLGLPSGKKLSVSERFYQLQQNLLSKRYEKLGLTEDASLTTAPYFERAEVFLEKLYATVRPGYEINDAGSVEKRIHRLEKAINTRMDARFEEMEAQGDTSGKKDPVIGECKADLKKVQEMRRLRDFAREVYGSKPTITQEEIAESLKAIRQALIKGNPGAYGSLPVLKKHKKLQAIEDEIATMMPEPVGPRTAHIRIGQPINVSERLEAAQENGQSPEVLSGELLDRTHDAMQDRLDTLNAEIEKDSPRIRESNPFYQQRRID